MREKAADLWFTSTSLFQFDEVIRFFATRGISLVNPGNGEVTMISDLGDPVVADEIVLSKAYKKDNLVRFDLWLDASHNLFTQVSKSSDGTVSLHFGLDSFDEHHLTQLTNLCVALAARYGRTGARGLVVDWEGYSEGFDWLSWIDSSTGIPPA